MTSLQFDDVDAELAASVRRYCLHHATDDTEQPLPAGWWTGLAELGVLGLATPDGGGSITSITAAMEELGRADAPGPLVATFIAGQLVDRATRQAIASGTALAAVGVAPLVPWLPHADVVVLLDGPSAHLARVLGDVERVQVLGGEPWGRATFERIGDLGPAAAAVAVGDVALGAYVTASGARLVEEAAAYATDRVQFGQPIGAFQAVSHPLADVFVRLAAARTLVRMAAHALDIGTADGTALAAAGRLSAAGAAMAAAFRAHQTYGAVGFTVEGPVGARSARIRQLTLAPPGDRHARDEVLTPHGLGPTSERSIAR
jgi:alkylation response protein AidB-like acyl-CoA dehydrogenase